MSEFEPDFTAGDPRSAGEKAQDAVNKLRNADNSIKDIKYAKEAIAEQIAKRKAAQGVAQGVTNALTNTTGAGTAGAAGAGAGATGTAAAGAGAGATGAAGAGAGATGAAGSAAAATGAAGAGAAAAGGTTAAAATGAAGAGAAAAGGTTAAAAGGTAATGGGIAALAIPIGIAILVFIALIIVVNLVAGVSSVASNLKSVKDCTPAASPTQVIDFFMEQGVFLSEEEKTTFDELVVGSCRSNGEGYNGEVFPPSLGSYNQPYPAYTGGGAHTGIDMGEGCGAPIYAWAGGEVTIVVLGSEEKSVWGGSIASTVAAMPSGDIWIQHTENIKTRYHHMNGSDTTVRVGDIVDAGQIIAREWSNGLSSGCHLHFEYFIDNKTVNPADEIIKCGFDIKLGQKLANPPTEPVMCGDPEGGSSGGTSSGAKTYAKSKMARVFNYNGSELERQNACLVVLWNRESSWNPLAENPSSGAYGIPQSLPGSKMATAGADWRTNPNTQIDWGLDYIKGRYGSPCNAKEFSDANNYY